MVTKPALALLPGGGASGGNAPLLSDEEK